MRKKIASLLFCFLGFYLLQAQGIPDLSQYKTIEEKLQALARKCDELNEAGKYEEATGVARYALGIAPVKDWDNLSRFNYYLTVSENEDTAIYYAERAVHYGKLSKDKERLTFAIGRLLEFYTHTIGHENRKQQVVAEIQSILDTTRDDNVKTALYAPIADYYGAIGAHEKQITYLLDNVTLAKKQLKAGKSAPSEAVNLGIYLLNIGMAYIGGLQQGEKALPYLQEARQYIDKDEEPMSYYYTNMANAYMLLHQLPRVTVYYDSLTRMCQQGYTDGWGNRVKLDMDLATYFLAEKNNDKALEYVLGAASIIEKWPNDLVKMQLDLMTGRVYAARGEYEKALPYLKASEPYCRQTRLSTYADLLQTLARCYAGVGQWQQAYSYYEQYAPVRDSLYNDAAKQSLANAEARYQNKEKQQQIDTQKAQLTYAARQRLWLIAGLSLLGLVALLLVVIYRNKRRTAKVLDENNKRLSLLNRELEEANQTKAKLFGIISHDLRSPINQVYQFLKLQQLAPDRLDAAQKSVLSQKIQSATGSLLETMEDLLLWSKTQMNQFTTSLQEVSLDEVVPECLQLMQLNMEAKQLVVTNDIPAGKTVYTDPYFLQTILRNLFQNAVKAAPSHGKVDIRYAQIADEGMLSIANEGSVFTQEDYEKILTSKEDSTSLSGLGLRLVHELAQKAGARVLFATGRTTGTTVTVTLPLSS